MKPNHLDIAIIGGGASGIFAAIRAAEVAKKNGQPIKVTVYEASTQLLKKVKISGGGRCNVTHHQFDPRVLAQHYPRGQRELLSPFQRFQAEDTVAWFKQRGVSLKFEDDGRMFPVTDSSQTIIDCFVSELERLKVSVLKATPVKNVKVQGDSGFSLFLKDGSEKHADRILIATGSSAKGYEIASELGHSITELAPSLFTFKIDHPLIADLAGTTFPKAGLQLKMEGEKTFKQSGPLLITHWGLSGPALLKLSAWAAREMKRVNYNARVLVNWMGYSSEGLLRQDLEDLKSTSAKSYVQNSSPSELTKRFWKSCLSFLEIDEQKTWSEVSKKEYNRMISLLYSTDLQVSGKSRFKEEFVECGGVNLKEIDFKSMESRKVPGLFFTGEILDIDGITGGFNFQNAWTGAWIAGEALAEAP